MAAIKRVGNSYQVTSDSGTFIYGVYKTLEEAKRRWLVIETQNGTNQ